MTARNASLGTVLYSNESTFCETTATATTRLLTVDELDLTGLEQPKQNINPLKQRPHDAVQDIRLGFGGSFSISMLLTGHGGTSAGAQTAFDLATFLGDVLGDMNAASDGGTCSGGGSTTVFTTASTSYSAGHVVQFGALGDGRGNGQFQAISGQSVNTVTTLTALDATPNAADVAYSSTLVYPAESDLETVVSMRFRLMTANNQFLCRGCYPTAVAITGLNAGEIPKVTVTFGVSQWQQDLTETFPSTTATAAKVGAPVAAGSVFINPVGTATRATYGLRNLDFTINNEVVPIMGPGGNYTHQVTVGARRLRCQAQVAMTFDAEANGTETWDTSYTTAENTLTNYHILYTFSVADGKSLGIYLPNAKIITPRPTVQNVGGLNRVTATFEGTTNTVTTNDLTLANFKIAMA